MNKKEKTQNICNQLEGKGYDFAIAIATKDEIKNGAACGQLSIVTDIVEK